MNPNPYHPSQIDSALRPEPPVMAALVGEDGGMSIDFEIWREDLVRFMLFHHRSSPATRRQRNMAMLAICLCCGLLLAIIGYFASQSPELWLVAAAVLVALVIGLIRYPKIHEQKLRNLVERMYSEGRNLLLYGPRRVGLTPHYLNNASPHSQSVTRWLAVEKVVVGEEALYIYISSVSSIVVPRRAFSSDDHFQTFVHTAQDYHSRALAAENPQRTSL